VSKRKSFLIHIDSLDVLDDLTVEQCGELFQAIKAHHKDEELELNPLVKIAFSAFKNQFIRDDEKYTKTCERRAIAGSKGGKQKVANASNCKQKIANVADSVSKNDSKSKNKSDSDNKRKVFKPPLFQEVCDYITDKKYTVSANQWMSHYESNGWMVGRNKMKDWKAAVRTWNNRNKENETNKRNTQQSTAERVSNKLDEIAARDIAENGFTHTLDN